MKILKLENWEGIISKEKIFWLKLALLSGIKSSLFTPVSEIIRYCYKLQKSCSSVQWTEAAYEESVTLCYSIVKTVLIKETRLISVYAQLARTYSQMLLSFPNNKTNANFLKHNDNLLKNKTKTNDVAYFTSGIFAIKAQRNNTLPAGQKDRVRGHQLNLAFINAHVQSKFSFGITHFIRLRIIDHLCEFCRAFFICFSGKFG